MFSGAGTALNWTTFGYYVSICADDGNRGRFTGYAWNFVTLAFLLAMIFGGYVVGRFGYLVFYTVVPIITALAGVVTLWLPTPEPIIVDGEIDQTDQETSTQQSSISVDQSTDDS